MSNILAAIGRGQLRVLNQRIEAKRNIFAYYQEGLGDLSGVEFMPGENYGRCTRWLTCLTIDPAKFGVDRETVRLALESENIEARPVWKPMHLQPVFKSFSRIGGNVAEDLFNKGLCLPSGTAMTKKDLDRVVKIIVDCSR
jgi:dTDP-4-amino-4,6-dideoxygalactose transaminase